MPKKLTIEEFRHLIDIKFNGEVRLLSTEYINCMTPLLFQCKCGNTFKATYNVLENNKRSGLCLDCAKKARNKTNAKNFDLILQEIKQNGCEYVCGDYINNRSKLILKCKCGNIFETNYMMFHQGKCQCNDCGNKKSIDSRRYDFSLSLNKINNNNCEYINGEYINTNSILTLRCNCGKIFNKTVSALLYNNEFNCPSCGYKRGSELKKKYVYDMSPELFIDKYFRKRLYTWQNEIKKTYENKCAITENTTNLVVHHLYGFNLILESAIDLYCNKKLNNHDKLIHIETQEEFENIENYIMSNHNINTGILITSEIHDHFHSIYGRGNNTPEQFEEYLWQNYHLHLSDIQRS